MLELYSDYIISSFSYVTATGLSAMLDEQICHDKVTKFLNKELYSAKDLWQQVKPTVRKINWENDVLVVDDTIQEKAYTDENDIICRHRDHAKWRNVKGINMLSLLLVPKETDFNIPIDYEIIEKTEKFIDKKSWKEKRKSDKNKNEILREKLDNAVRNWVKFKYLLADARFCSKENMQKIFKLKKEFIMEIKVSRLVALSIEDKLAWKFVNVSSLWMKSKQVVPVYIKWLDRPVLICRQVFKNKDESTWERYLICSDMSLKFSSITTIYKKRWKVEESYKSVKYNAGFGKSPTKTKKSQKNHFFCSMYTYFKLQVLSSKLKLNNFALKGKLYVKAIQAS